MKISFGSSVEQNLKKVDLKHSTNHDNRHKNRSSPRRWINQKRKRIKIVCGCSLTWHQWLLGRISNCRRATDLAKDHPVAPALRFAGNLTYNRFVSQLWVQVCGCDEYNYHDGQLKTFFSPFTLKQTSWKRETSKKQLENVFHLVQQLIRNDKKSSGGCANS